MLYNSPNQRNSTNSKAGFSFLEIMLVVAIIGILVSLVSVSLAERLNDAKITATKSQMDSIEAALGLFEIDTGSYPTTEQGLKALVVRPSELAEDQWKQLMNKMPRDAWKQKFIYRSPGQNGTKFDLISKGKDKKEGTADDIDINADEAEGDLSE